MKKWLVIFPVSCLFFVGLLGLLDLTELKGGSALSGPWAVDDGRSVTMLTPPFQIYKAPFPRVSLTAFLPRFLGDTMVLGRVRASALEVRIAGELVYQVGQLDNPAASVRNLNLFVSIPEHLRTPGLPVQIRISDPVRCGLTIPPQLGYFRDFMPLGAWSNWLLDSLVFLGIGAAVAVGFMLLLFTVLRKTGWDSNRYMGVAVFLVAVYCLGSTSHQDWGSSALWVLFQRVSQASGFLASLAFVASLEIYYGGRLKWTGLLALGTTLAAGFILLYPSVTVIWSSFAYLDVFLLVNLIFVIGLLVYRKNPRSASMVSATLLILALVHTIYVLFISPGSIFSIQYIVLFSAEIYGSQLILDFVRVFQERDRLHEENLLDPLTGAFNRRILAHLDSRPSDILVSLDLDKFKKVNDVYGHAAGDKLLLDLMKLFRENVRNNDEIVRMGGDEFLLVLHRADLVQAETVVQRIVNGLQAVVPDPEVGLSYGIVVFESSMAESVRRSDAVMYAMKQQKHRDLR